MSAPKHNQNAAKDDAEQASSFLFIRCRPKDKAAWVKAARPGGLSEWVIRTLVKAASDTETPAAAPSKKPTTNRT